MGRAGGAFSETTSYYIDCLITYTPALHDQYGLFSGPVGSILNTKYQIPNTDTERHAIEHGCPRSMVDAKPPSLSSNQEVHITMYNAVVGISRFCGSFCFKHECGFT